MANSAPVASPDELVLHAKPRLTARLNRRAVIGVVAILGAILAVITLNVSQPAQGSKKADDDSTGQPVDAKAEPAMASAQWAVKEQAAATGRAQSAADAAEEAQAAALLGMPRSAASTATPAQPPLVELPGASGAPSAGAPTGKSRSASKVAELPLQPVASASAHAGSNSNEDTPEKIAARALQADSAVAKFVVPDGEGAGSASTKSVATGAAMVGGQGGGMGGQGGGVSSPTAAAAGAAGTSVLGAAAYAAGKDGRDSSPSDDDANRQQAKRTFLDEASRESERGARNVALVSPRTPYELKTGTVIPAVLITEINSDLPGELVGQVTQNVFDTATGRYLLVPQGTKLFGRYDSQVAFGQSRLLVVWSRLIFPNAQTVELGGMAGTDKAGKSGFGDQVNNHYLRTFGVALLTSLFSAAYQLSQPNPAANSNATYTNQQVAGAAVGQQMAALGTESARRNLNVQPTIEIRKGHQFTVMVNRDLVFPGPFRP